MYVHSNTFVRSMIIVQCSMLIATSEFEAKHRWNDKVCRLLV